MSPKTQAALLLSACFILFACNKNEQANNFGVTQGHENADQQLIGPGTDTTTIHLSAEEAQRFSEDTGVGYNGSTAGGVIVLAGTPEDPEIKEILEKYRPEMVEVSRSGSFPEGEPEPILID